MHIYYLVVSVSRESEHGLAGASASPLITTAVEVSARTGVSSEDLCGEESTSKLTYMDGGRIQFLKVFWNQDLSALLAVDWRPPSIPCHMGLSNQ